MCMGVPMEVQSVEGVLARCEAKGVVREVSLLMVLHEGVAPGDHVLVTMGQAVSKMTAEQAAETWTYLDEMLELEDERLAREARAREGIEDA